jgi:hypothetical protein
MGSEDTTALSLAQYMLREGEQDSLLSLSEPNFPQLSEPLHVLDESRFGLPLFNQTPEEESCMSDGSLLSTLLRAYDDVRPEMSNGDPYEPTPFAETACVVSPIVEDIAQSEAFVTSNFSSLDNWLGACEI